MIAITRKSLALPLLMALNACGSSKSSDNEVVDASGTYAGTGGVDTTSVTTETGASVDSTVLADLVGHFRFTDSMDSEIINFMRYDFGTLASWNDSTRTTELARLAQMYGISEANRQTLSQWLMDRITYIYPDDGELLKFAFIVSSERRVYQLSVDTSGGEGVAASNIGGGLYAMYLDQSSQGVDGLLLNFNDDYLPFLSPRTGVMQIGPNYFDSTDSLDVSNTDRRGFRTIKSLYRLSILFHEARHSDGNSQAGTLSFAHIICPSDGSVDEEYEGLPACDDKANGAYNIGAQILASMQGVCDGICSERELAILESIELDMTSRLQVDDKTENYGDATPEPQLTTIETQSFEIIPE